jgi:WD40 repeat protein
MNRADPSSPYPDEHPAPPSRKWLALLAALLVGAAIPGAFLWRSQRERAAHSEALQALADLELAERQRQMALSEQLEKEKRRADSLFFANQLLRANALLDSDPGEAARLLDDGNICWVSARDLAWSLCRRWARCQRWQHESHGRRAYSVAYHPRSGAVASTGAVGVIMLRDAAGKELRELSGEMGPLYAVAFSPDGRWLAAGGVNGVLLWNPSEGRAFTPQDGHGRFCCVAFSPDSRTLAAGGGEIDSAGEVRLWDTGTGRLRDRFRRHSKSVFGLAFHPDGKHLASAGEDGQVQVHDLQRGTNQEAGHRHRGPAFGVAYSPDGKTLASAGEDGTVQLRDPLSADTYLVLEGHNNAVRGVAFSPDGRLLLSCGMDRTIRLWDADSAAPRSILRGHDEAVVSAAFAPDSKTVASAGWDGTVRAWNIGPRREPVRIPMKSVAALALSPAGDLAAAAGEWENPDGQRLRGIGVWRTDNGKQAFVLSEEADCRSLLFSPDARTLFSGAAHGKVKVWDVAGRRVTATLGEVGLSVVVLAVSPDGTLLADVRTDGRVRVWDVASGQARFRWLGQLGDATALAFTPDGSLLVTYDTVRKLSTGEAVKALGNPPDGPVRAVAWGLDRHLVAVFETKTDDTLRRYIRHLKPETWNEGDRTDVPAEDVALLLTPDGRTLVGAGRGGVRLWDTLTGQERLTFPLPVGGRAGRLAVSADGKTLAATGSADRQGEVILVWPGER